MQKIKCKKCLMRDMDKTEYFIELGNYIKGIPEEEKVSDDSYEERLSICKNCENLVSGMCTKCGCYVELRAAIKEGYCPDIETKWLAENR